MGLWNKSKEFFMYWHRATVRSFLSAMEAFGLLTRIQLPKSVVITMTVQSGQAAQPRNAQEQPDFARRCV